MKSGKVSKGSGSSSSATSSSSSSSSGGYSSSYSSSSSSSSSWSESSPSSPAPKESKSSSWGGWSSSSDSSSSKSSKESSSSWGSSSDDAYSSYNPAGERSTGKTQRKGFFSALFSSVEEPEEKDITKVTTNAKSYKNASVFIEKRGKTVQPTMPLEKQQKKSNVSKGAAAYEQTGYLRSYDAVYDDEDDDDYEDSSYTDWDDDEEWGWEELEPSSTWGWFFKFIAALFIAIFIEIGISYFFPYGVMGVKTGAVTALIWLSAPFYFPVFRKKRDMWGCLLGFCVIAVGMLTQNFLASIIYGGLISALYYTMQLRLFFRSFIFSACLLVFCLFKGSIVYLYSASIFQHTALWFSVAFLSVAVLLVLSLVFYKRKSAQNDARADFGNEEDEGEHLQPAKELTVEQSGFFGGGMDFYALEGFLQSEGLSLNKSSPYYADFEKVALLWQAYPAEIQIPVAKLMCSTLGIIESVEKGLDDDMKSGEVFLDVSLPQLHDALEQTSATLENAARVRPDLFDEMVGVISQNLEALANTFMQKHQELLLHGVEVLSKRLKEQEDKQK